MKALLRLTLAIAFLSVPQPLVAGSAHGESAVPGGATLLPTVVAPGGGRRTVGDLLTLEQLRHIEMMIMNSPPTPPKGFGNRAPARLASAAVMLTDVPTSEWTYGCSPTAAGMMFGYYDRNGYPDMYTGPANGGIAPLADLGATCSLIATQLGFDGRVTRGYVDDYWIAYEDPGPDPWEGNWTEHAWGECTGDYLGTSQWKWDFEPWPGGDGLTDANTDGGTRVFTNADGSKLYDFVPPSGLGEPQTALSHGLRLFAESRGYTVEENYTQKIDALEPGGFSFADYAAEIDGGYPVMIHLVGHSMVGVGYDAATQTAYVHDTYDNAVHSMTWGGSYMDMAHRSVTVIHLAGEPPVTVPDVVGLPEADAEAVIIGAALSVGTVTQAHSNTIPAGHVMCQAPPAGTSALAGSPVNMVVSLGPGAGPFYVDDDGPDDPGAGTALSPFRRIQDGLNNAGNGDTVIVRDGTYTGDGNRDLDFGGRGITLQSEHGAASTIIDCERNWSESHRGFDFHSGESAASIVDGFTVQNGYTENDGGNIVCIGSSPTITNCTIRDGYAYNEGGGIYCRDGGNATISNCTIIGNETQREYGGGIACFRSSPIITNCTISENHGDTSGGGISCVEYSNAIIRDCVIVDNDTGWGYGGGIFCRDASNPVIEECTISWNVAYSSGGGIGCMNDSSPTISDCTLANNWAWTKYGGGIHCFVRSSPQISRCLISGNRSFKESGGGIYCWIDSSPLIQYCTITGNIALEGGGGIGCNENSDPVIFNCAIVANSATDFGGGFACLDSSEARAIHCTIADNSAAAGAGLYCDSSSPTFANCILWNQGPDEVAAASGTPTITDCNVRGGYPGTGNIDGDPRFINPARGDYHIQHDSPCIDAGTSAGTLPTDFDGESRWDHPLIPNSSDFPKTYHDIGFDEYVDGDLDTLPDHWEAAHGLDPSDDGSVNVNNGPTGDPDGDGLTNYDELLLTTEPDNQDTDGDSVSDSAELTAGTNPFHPDNHEKTYYVNAATGSDSHDGLTKVWDGVHGPKQTIQGGIDATMTGWGHVVEVADGTYLGPGNRNIEYRGKAITVRSENGPETTIIDCEGAGRGFDFIYLETSEAAVEGLTIRNGVGKYGSAIHCYRSDTKIRNCVFTGNSADHGTVYCSDSASTITDCTFVGNNARLAAGLYWGFGCNLSVTDCTFSGNSASYSGGAINAAIGGATLTNCVITGNTATSCGGGVCLKGGTLTNCIIADNEAEEDGGGVYCREDSYLTLVNCTLSGNTAPSGRGGGIFSAFHGQPTISNCLIVGNSARVGGGIWNRGHDWNLLNCTLTGNSAAESGGGTAYEGSAAMTNCILWGNAAPEGHEIAVISTSSLTKPTVTVRNSDVQGGVAESYVDEVCTLDWDASNIDADPFFVGGPLHDYYLSQVAAGQGADSPCVDAGSDTAANLGLDAFTTRTDHVADSGTVDMGYHSPTLPAVPGDVDGNGVVDGLDLTAVLNAWECVPGDALWNPRADLDGNGLIDGLDLTEVISNWTTAAASAAAEPTATVKLHRRGAHRSNMRRGSGSGNVRRK